MRGFAYLMVLLATVPVWVSASEPAGVADFFVSPSGNDANSGTKQEPYASLRRAQQAVRQRIARGLDSDVHVFLRAGTYELTEPMAFDQGDSGNDRFAVSYAALPGETVVISGGRKVTGWQRNQGEVWTASVPDVKADGWQFRNLFVNGRRAVRARTPNHDAAPSCWNLQGAELSSDLSRFTLTLAPGVLGNWQNPTDMEVMIAGNWEINRKPVEKLDPGTSQIVLAPPHQRSPEYILPGRGRWCFLENVRDALDEEGEWYLDRRTGQLSYWPLSGEDMGRAEVVAPAAQQLVIVKGTPGHPVRNLHFKGLRFEHTNWQLPPGGYVGIQACHFQAAEQPGRQRTHIPAALEFAWVEHCSVEDCVIARLGGAGIEVAEGCLESLVQGNHVYDLSGNGIMLGGPNREADVPKGNRVSNNHVHACGREYYGAVGIWVGFAQETAIAHNLVHDLPYTGISVGWQWDPAATAHKATLVECNHVYDVMNRLCDGGCLYTLGFQPGTVIRGNHFHDVRRNGMAQGAPNNGMFIDEGSKGFLFEKNAVYNAHGELVRFNQCQRDWHTWQDNCFGSEAEVKQSGREIIDKAGLESPWRELLK